MGSFDVLLLESFDKPLFKHFTVSITDILWHKLLPLANIAYC